MNERNREAVMKTFISKLAIATIFSIILVAVLTISSHVQSHKITVLTQSQPAVETASGICNTLLNTLNEISWR
jgi:ABC-type phosphate transport system permease subunit